MEILPRYLPNIQEIRLEYCTLQGYDVQPWSQINSLQKLIVVGSNIPIELLIHGCKNIEHLELLEMAFSPNFIDHSLRSMKGLSILHLEKIEPDIDEHQLLSILLNCPGLTELVVETQSITLDKIKRILQKTKPPPKFHVQLNNAELEGKSDTDIFQAIGCVENVRIS